MGESGRASPTVSIPVGFGPDSGDPGLTPGRRAIERIKRKATGMASDAAAEPLDLREVPCPWEDATEDSVPSPSARKCRCADADVKAYREGSEWVCYTCGHQLSEWASGLLTRMARARECSPGARDPARMQFPVS